MTQAKHGPGLSQALKNCIFFSISGFYDHRKAILETSFDPQEGF